MALREEGPPPHCWALNFGLTHFQTLNLELQTFSTLLLFMIFEPLTSWLGTTTICIYLPLVAQPKWRVKEQLDKLTKNYNFVVGKTCSYFLKCNRKAPYPALFFPPHFFLMFILFHVMPTGYHGKNRMVFIYFSLWYPLGIMGGKGNCWVCSFPLIPAGYHGKKGGKFWSVSTR
jgi:hypothetical protein